VKAFGWPTNAARPAGIPCAAVHVDRLAGEERGLVGRKKKRRPTPRPARLRWLARPDWDIGVRARVEVWEIQQLKKLDTQMAGVQSE